MKQQTYASSSVWNARAVGTMVLVAGSLVMAQLGTVSADAPLTQGAMPIHGDSNGGGALAVPSLAPNLPIADQRLIDLDLRDTPVRDVLAIIGKFAGINIVVSDDVNGIVTVNLGGVSPEAAIKSVARAKNLKYRKYTDGTYIVAKVLPTDDEDEAPPTIMTPATGVAPGMGGAPMMGGMQNSVPSLFDKPVSNDPNEIVGTKRRVIRLKYVKPSLMAYWLDQQHQPMPYEIKLSNKGQQDVMNPYIGRPAIDPREMALANGNLLGVNNGNFANPYGSSTVSGGALGQFNTGSPSGSPYGGSGYYEANPQFGSGAVGGGGQIGGGGGGGGGGQGRGGNNRNGGGGNGNGNGNGGGFDLPQGVQRLVVVDPQNLLLVQTEDSALGVTGFNELRDLISLLDRPLQQVEIEAQFVRVATSAARRLSGVFTSSNGTLSSTFAPSAPSSAGSFTLTAVRRNFQATLQALEQDSQIKIVQSPRVTAINNLTASLLSQTALPILINNTVQNNNNGGTTTNNFPQTAYINLNIGLTVTPTINGDGTVTVVLSPQIQTAAGPPNSQGAPPIATSTVQTVAIVRDGDTIALGGLRAKNNTNQVDKVPILGDIPIIGRLFQAKNRSVSDDDLIIFLTARIVHRSAGDDSPVIGADTTTAPQ